MSTADALTFLRSQPTADDRVARNHVNGLADAITAATGLKVHTNLALQTFT